MSSEISTLVVDSKGRSGSISLNNAKMDNYYKLRSKGMPEDLVRRKMMYDGFRSSEIDDFFGGVYIPSGQISPSKKSSKKQSFNDLENDTNRSRKGLKSDDSNSSTDTPKKPSSLILNLKDLKGSRDEETETSPNKRSSLLLSRNGTQRNSEFIKRLVEVIIMYLYLLPHIINAFI
jgi:hypothetical protein